VTSVIFRCGATGDVAASGGRVPRAALVVALLVLHGAAAPARAHVVYGARTLSQLTAMADAVVRARVSDADAVVVRAQPLLRQPIVAVEVLESVKGDLPCGPLTFAPHGHGVARYADGEEVVLFLRDIAHSRELADTSLAAAVAWISEQETPDKIVLGRGADDPVLAAVRAYAGLGALPSDTARREALRRITLRLVGAHEPRLATAAVSDLILADASLPITATGLPALLAILDDGAVAIGARLALLAELERRKVVDGAAHWVRLLRTTDGAEGLAVIHAVATHPSAGVTRELLAILAGADSERAATAAVSLGTPGNGAAVEPLAQVLAGKSPRLRMAAIRGLGRIATPAAARALEFAAEFHPDPATRRRARAERIVLARAHAQTPPR
jgi:HEAT repeats